MIGRFLWVALVGCGGAPQAVEPGREACLDHSPDRNLYWGDLHVHTSLSFDAWIYDMRLGPDDAYAFAQGEAKMLPPLDASGSPTVQVQLERPLDFAAVTDHSEYLAEVRACTDSSSPAYGTSLCVDYRDGSPASIQTWGSAFVPVDPQRFSAICDLIDCASETRDVWTEVQDAAEQSYDRTSACTFTSFVAYEWSATPNISNLHRNVIFRGSRVPVQPISMFDAPTPDALWDALNASCTDALNGCEVLAIPHNPNQSNGHLFPAEYANKAQAIDVAWREPVVEIFQHKGDSECRTGVFGVSDEACDFEKLRGPEPTEDCGDAPGQGGMAGLGCQHRTDFVRGMLLQGLEIERELGVNPYNKGFIGSSDTHNGTPGAVEEDQFAGHLGRVEGTPEARLELPQLNPGGVRNNPGGLAGVWAVENSRGAIFDAIRRKEVYGTSGPRIAVRMFAAEELPDAICGRADFVPAADTAGVPMGGTLQTSVAPTFAISALMDPGTKRHPGRQLHRIELVKGWVDDSGTHMEVVEVIGTELGQVDEATCEVDGDEEAEIPESGAAHLCAVWTDPNWRAGQDAVYYARVLEQPVCRWSWRDCLSIPEDLRPETCSDPTVAHTIQERAWTSPIQVRER